MFCGTFEKDLLSVRGTARALGTSVVSPNAYRTFSYKGISGTWTINQSSSAFEKLVIICDFVRFLVKFVYTFWENFLRRK